MPVAITSGLRQRGVNAWSARDAGNLGSSDEEQLKYAAREHAVIFTHDADFLVMAHHWARQNRTHWGIIFAPEQKLGIGECIRRLMNYAWFIDAEAMKNRIEFL